MGWDGVPWLMGGGVKHSTNIARLLAYVAFSGQAGIIGPRDLQVRERAVPNGTIRVAPGAASIINKAAGIVSESYAARLPTEDVVAVDATGSGGWRTDLVVARVENPFLAGEPYTPPSAPDIEAGNVQFVFTRVIPNILSGSSGLPQHPTLAQITSALAGMSAIPLASIAIPASTGTIIQSYIKDQRTVAQGREITKLYVENPSGTTTLDATWKPIAATFMDIPPWATHFSVAGAVMGLRRDPGDIEGSMRVQLGNSSPVYTEVTGWNLYSADADRVTFGYADGDVPIPVNFRGTTQPIYTQMNKTFGSAITTVDASSSISMNVVFHCKPESN